MAQIQAVSPVSDEDPSALPVKDLGPAIRFYEAVLGFTPVGRDRSTAVLARDAVQVGLVVKPDHGPGRAGSLVFEVDDLQAMHRDQQSRGGHPGEFGTDESAGRQQRTFFLREEENGYCFCFYRVA